MPPTRSPRPPSVERLLAAARGLAARDPAAGRTSLDERSHEALVAVGRAVVAAERARIAGGEPAAGLDDLAGDLLARLEGFGRSAGPGLGPVINATGVILHTNLGRAPWPMAAIEAARSAAGYAFLELDPGSGRRGRRVRVAEEHLVALTGAEDALVTNNNAAAVALVVGLAGRGGVVVSRGELVEIGGGVRIPEIVRRAGAHLVEVGTTNRTRTEDFEAPLADGRARMVLRVHPSNFVMKGFTEGPDDASLATLVHRHGAILVDDLGSGALLDTSAFGLAHEPTPRERLAAGADLVTFSGDKLLGGPQAGLIVGRADLIARIRRDPLARAARPDKVALAALAATLGLYRAGRALAEIPIWRMIARSPTELRRRAERLAAAIGDARVHALEVESTVGGGSLPGDTLASYGLSLQVGSPDRLASALRTGEPAIVPRISDGMVILDLRTVEAENDPLVEAGLRAALGRHPAGGRSGRRDCSGPARAGAGRAAPADGAAGR